MPYPVLWLGGLFDPIARELRETALPVRPAVRAGLHRGDRRRSASSRPRWTVLAETVAALRR